MLDQTTSSELVELMNKMRIPSNAAIRKKDLFKTKARNVIINLDDTGSGSHWVAVCKPKKLYFDSYGQPPPEVIPTDYKYSTKIIQGIQQRDCGQLCALWLYYVNFENEDKFYQLFNGLYE